MLLTLLFATTAAAIIPTLEIPSCPDYTVINYNTSVPPGQPFPETSVELCYSTTSINIVFRAQDANFFFNPNYTTNDPIYEYEVMETFISAGSSDPRTYLEFEVAPNNVTFNAFIYNPGRGVDQDAPFDTLFIPLPLEDGIVAEMITDGEGRTWRSEVDIPLGFFNVQDGEAKGTEWRMNFYRTVVEMETFPEQVVGAWKPFSEDLTGEFGRVRFI